ncbi:hypothetical protein ACGGZK_10495 [Agromyces sp. MMS24-K17]|uniref:hypothetical protein n=1 Tax=Agromyces sp. MMS24-K17 TaxID=3372850 RepID=UPI003754A32D
MDDRDDREHRDELDPVERLRAADPAAGVEPAAGFADAVVARAAADAPTVDAAVADATAGAGTTAGASPEASGAASTVDLAAERERRRPRWVAVAAVAASIAIVGAVGVGGYAIGAGTGGSTLAGAAPPITLPGATGTTEEARSADAGAVAPDAAKMSAGIYPGGWGRNSFHASGLSTTAGSAAGYGYDARSASNAETVGALAAGLGLSGTPALQNGAWVVGVQDGTAPSLSVNLDATLSFWYSDPRINPWDCGDGSAPCVATGDLPSEQAAIDALRSVIVAAGKDPAAFEFASQTWEGAASRSAQAWPVVDGQRLDQGWSLELTQDGVMSVNGFLADLVPIGDYPVVSEQEAFERLSDPRFGAQVTAMPYAMREEAIAADDSVATDGPASSDGSVSSDGSTWVPPTEPPATPTEGTAVSWPVNDVEIVSARLGLASQWQPDGSVLVVPAYAFTDAAGGTWSVIAVADAKLDFTAP